MEDFLNSEGIEMTDFQKTQNDPFSPKVTLSDSEQLRIDRAFKRQETHPINIRSKNYNEFMLRNSNSMQGIINPNYGNSPTSSKTSLDNLDLGNTTPNDGQKTLLGN